MSLLTQAHYNLTANDVTVAQDFMVQNTLALTGAPTGTSRNAITKHFECEGLTTQDALVTTGKSGFGYALGAGVAVTQSTSRTTTVTANGLSGVITLVSAPGPAGTFSFTVLNSAVTATDTITVSQQTGIDQYTTTVTDVSVGSFQLTLNTPGSTTEQPVFQFAVIKAVTTPGLMVWEIASGSNFENSGRSVVYANGLWVAGGYVTTVGLPTLLWSTDGKNWNAGTNFFATRCYWVAYGNGRWVAVGTDPVRNIKTSLDGKNWSDTTGAQFTNNGVFVTYNEFTGTWMAGGNDPTQTVLRSTDGVTWSTVAGTLAPTASFAIDHDENGRWVAVGSNPRTVCTSGDDGLTWQQASGANLGTYGYGVNYRAGRWVAYGQPGGSIPGPVITSTDGINWIYGNGITGYGSADGLDYGNGRWVLTCSGSALLTIKTFSSDDGVNWVPTVGPQLIAGRGVGFSNGRWVIVGYDNVTGNSLLTSVDGIVFEYVAGTKWPANYGRAVASDGAGRWVACGDVSATSSSILTSFI